MRPETLWLIAPVALVAACSSQHGAVYAVPIEQAQTILAGTGLPPFVFGTEEPNYAVSTEGPSRIVWSIRQDGAEMMRYVAELSRDGDASTRVRLELHGATEGPFGNVEQRLTDNASIRNLYMVAMEERIASALEHRQFEMARIYPALGKATVANIGEISGRMDRAAEEYHRRDRENIEKAYREEGQRGGN